MLRLPEQPARRAATLVALAAAIAILPSGTPATASGYQPVFADGGGGDAAASIYCSPGLIRLGDPIITPIPPTDAISARQQWVAWNVAIWYSTDLQTWAPTGATAYWYFGQVSDYIGISYNTTWYSTQSQTWGSENNPIWNVNFKGYYAAMMQAIWYLPDGSVAMLTAQPPAYTLGAGGQWSDRSPYCTMF